MKYKNNYSLIRSSERKRRNQNKTLSYICAVGLSLGGLFGLSEAINYINEKRDKEILETSLNKFTEILDKNRDGVLSREEVNHFYDSCGINPKTRPLDSINESQWGYFLNDYR